MSLADEPCRPPARGASALAPETVRELVATLEAEAPGWELRAGSRLHRRYACADFRSALAFVNRVADAAEACGHHPDIELGWGRVVLELSTHDVGGLSRADFVLAARIGALPAPPPPAPS